MVRSGELWVSCSRVAGMLRPGIGCFAIPLISTGAWMAEDGGELRAVADIGTHWLDLIQFIVNQRVSEVCIDLSTVYPQRSRPLGGVETFSGKVASQAATSIDVTTDDYGCVMLRFTGGGKGVMWVSQVTTAQELLQFEIAGSKQSIAWNSQSPQRNGNRTPRHGQ